MCIFMFFFRYEIVYTACVHIGICMTCIYIYTYRYEIDMQKSCGVHHILRRAEDAERGVVTPTEGPGAGPRPLLARQVVFFFLFYSFVDLFIHLLICLCIYLFILFIHHSFIKKFE